jgi:hypothetical protein
MRNIAENLSKTQPSVMPVDQSLLTYSKPADALSGQDKRRQFLEDFNGEHTASHVINLIAAADLRGIDKAGIEKAGMGQHNLANQILPSCVYLG